MCVFLGKMVPTASSLREMEGIQEQLLHRAELRAGLDSGSRLSILETGVEGLKYRWRDGWVNGPRRVGGWVNGEMGGWVHR